MTAHAFIVIRIVFDLGRGCAGRHVGFSRGDYVTVRTIQFCFGNAMAFVFKAGGVGISNRGRPGLASPFKDRPMPACLALTAPVEEISW